jgi:4-amino-4-deoxy-L-arabinose transferase-like glycosyltransferase
VLLLALSQWSHPWFDPMNDAATYILVARSLAAGEGYRLLGESFVLRPPLFPFLLALVMRHAGTDFAALNLLVGGFGIACTVLLFVCMRPRLGPLLSLLTAIAFWFAPGFQRLRNQVMSDVPATALMLLCLVVERWTARAPSWRREVALGLALGVAAQVRAPLVLLLPAILAARAAQQLWLAPQARLWRSFLWRRCAVLALTTGLALLPWSLYRAAHAPPPPADQTHAYSYSAGMWHVDQGDPSSAYIGPRDLVRRLDVQSRRITAALGSGLQDGAWSLRSALVGIALVACLAVTGFRRREPAELFALGILALLAVYFGFRARLALPVFAIALPAAVEVLRDASLALWRSRAVAWLAPACVALLIALEFEPRRGWDGIEARHRQNADRAAALAAQLPEDARPGTAIGTTYAVLLERPVWSLEFGVLRSGLPDGAEALIEKYRLDTVVLSPDEPLEARLIPYFRERYGEPVRAGSALIFRVRS